MSTLQIIGHAGSNFVWVVRIFCAEKGVAYELITAPPHSPEAKAVHPLGKIPGMRHGDVTLCESRAICSYIDAVFPGASPIPRDPVAAAKTEQWIAIICTAIDPMMVRQYLAGYFFPGTADGKPDRTRIDSALPKMLPLFDMLERTLASNAHLTGANFTLADAYLIPILHYMTELPEASAMIAERPAVKSYLDRQMARPSVKGTIPTH